MDWPGKHHERAPDASCASREDFCSPTHNGHGKKNGMSRARSTTDDDTETEDFNAAAFWRAPVGPPPTDAAAAKGATIAGPETVRAAIAAAEREAAAKAAAKKDAEKAAAEKAAAEKAAAEERRRKVAAYLMPMPLEEMSYEMIKERLYTFQQQWWARHGRRVTPEDERAGRVPVPIINLYTELGKRLTPEQVAADKARVEARQAAEKEAAAKAKADADAAAEADAARIASCKEARAKEWEEFEAGREAAWRSATTDARDQRVEAAGEVGAKALTGAATWVHVDEGTKDSRPTREEYLQQAMDEFGLRVEKDEAGLAAEAAQWERGGGAEADAVAQREAWKQRQGVVE